MKTKREVLIHFAKFGNCKDISCEECAYGDNCGKFTNTMRKIGARKILQMFPEDREFDRSKILTCVTADQAKVGMQGYFANCVEGLKYHFEHKNKTHLLTKIRDESFDSRFIKDNINCFSLFYPIIEVEE